MTDFEFLTIAAGFIVIGYLFARLVDAVRAKEAHHRRQEARRAAYMAARKPTLHPSRMAAIQELAELDDLRDYIRRDDVGA